MGGLQAASAWIGLLGTVGCYPHGLSSSRTYHQPRLPSYPAALAAVCDFNAAKAYAVPGTICYGAVCSGSIKKAPAEE